jgi:hypothetical protein
MIRVSFEVFKAVTVKIVVLSTDYGRSSQVVAYLLNYTVSRPSRRTPQSFAVGGGMVYTHYVTYLLFVSNRKNGRDLNL